MWLALVLALLRAPTPPRPDTYFLLNGDRLTGQTVTKGKSSFVLQTAVGRITIPKGLIQKIVYGDGHEELMNAPLPPPEGPLQLVLGVTGQAFWQAWPRPKDKELDPTLRLEVRLDGDVVVTYTDSHLDPGDLPGAIVNSFSFTPGEVSISAADGVIAELPETKPGRSVLRIHFPASRSGKRHLVVAYQSNSGTKAEPRWGDLTHGDLEVDLEQSAPVDLAMEQQRGRMEYSGFLGMLNKRMRNVDTFRIGLRPPGAPAPEPSPSPEESQ